MALPAEKTDDTQLLIRYLLGSLEEGQAERLDELSVVDDDFAWRLKAVENDMVDAYVRADLSGETLDRFRSFYLSTHKRRGRVEFARVLLAFTDKQAPPRGVTEERRGWFSIPLVMPRWAFACFAAAAVMVAGFLIYNQQQLQMQMSRLQTSQSELQAWERQLRSDLARESPAGTRTTEPPAATLTTLAVLLTPPTRSAAPAKIVKLAPGTARLAIDLQLEGDDFPSYRVTLKETAGGRVVYRSDDMKSHQAGGHPVVTVNLAAEVFQSRRYLAELSSGGQGTEPIANYPFEVQEK
jgi:hypothetical protein